MVRAGRLEREIWIIVVNWNGARLLPGCLASLTGLARPVHVLVVDNGSTDDSRAVVEATPGVEWLALGKNVGFAGANNVGIRRAIASGARWVGIVNSDVALEPDWVDRLIEAGDAHPEAGILGGLLLFADNPQLVNSTGLCFDTFGRARDRDFGVPLADLATQDGPVGGISGGAALFRTSSLRRMGLFDPAYFAYYEDVDLSLRAAGLGIQARYVSSARALHGYGKSFGTGSPKQRYLLARNHMRFMATHLPLPWAVTVAPLVTLFRATVKAPLELVRGKPAHASAHLRAAGAGALAALQALGKRFRHDAQFPHGADPIAGPR